MFPHGPSLSTVVGAAVTDGEVVCHETSILVVDDDDISRRVALGQLRAMGVQAEGVASGVRALVALQQRRYDAVLMDCQMPELDGYETTRRIRRSEGCEEHVVVIALTAHAADKERERCLLAGMDDCISKPLRDDQLNSLLDRWVLRAKRAERDQTKAAPQPSGPPQTLELGWVEAIRRRGARTGSNILAQLVGEYLKETPEQLEKMWQAFEHRDFSTVERVAHRMGGGSAILGASRLAELCGELEGLCQRKNVVACQRQLAAMTAEYSQLEDELEALIAASSPAVPA